MHLIMDILPKNLDPSDVATKGLLVFLTVVCALILHRVYTRSLQKFQTVLTESKKKSHKPAQAQRVQVVVGLLQQLGTVCITLFTIILVLDELGLDIRPILAGAGVLGLAVGFGSQSLVKDFFNGLCLILENQITIGDWVTINGKSGTVEVLNFRITVLRDSDGTIHIFPNGTINSLSNSTHGWSAAVLDLPVPHGQTFEDASKIFLSIAEGMRADEQWKDVVREDMAVQGVQDINERGMIVRMRITTTPGSHWSVAREFRKRLAEYWSAEGLEFPRPSQSLYLLERSNLERSS